jgi:hypothetical protein
VPGPTAVKDSEKYKVAAKAVFHRFAEALEPLGFTRTRKNFLVRPHQNWVDFVRASCPPLHRNYQLHASVRVLNDSFVAAAIVGPSTQSWDKRFDLCFVDSANSIERCATDMTAWVEVVALPWFASVSSVDSLLGEHSPLPLQSQVALADALAGRASPDNLRLSRRILGLQP